MQYNIFEKSLVVGIIILIVGTNGIANTDVDNSTSTKIDDLQSYSHYSGGECDLYIHNVTFAPNPPEYNGYLTIYYSVTDKLGNYNFIVYILLNSDVPKNGTWVCENGQGDLSFRWPLSIKSYNITLTAVPFEQGGWTETNWSDNSYTINNLSAGVIPTILFGSINNVTKDSKFINFNAKSVIYITTPFKIRTLKQNELITIPKQVLGYVGKHFIVSYFS